MVSFSAKKYADESILNPTNHCGYCGCKVYSEYQIESIAKEILSSKYDRMQGKIRSILEKLEGAKNSEELALAKRMENEDEIKFFKNLLEVASKKSFLKGDAIFQQVYETDSESALETIKMNLRPLLRTIDHVSPQNEGKDNNNSDINLVEACWCCNHDLKKGAPFIEFYTMYPSIKNNMPSEKFQYAASNLLDFQSNGILQRLSASNLLKTIKRLFIQRQEAQTYLDSIDFRIKKKAELLQKETQLAELKQDDEFAAILDRMAFAKSIDAHENVIAQLRAKLQSVSNQINELRDNPKKKTSKASREQKRDELTPEEKQERIASLKEQIKHLEEQILQQEIAKDELGAKIRSLDEIFPTIPMMQHQKKKVDSVINAYSQMTKTDYELNEKQSEYQMLQNSKKELESQLLNLPQSFDNPDVFPEDIQESYNRYLQLIEALTYIEEHPNGGNINVIIKQSAKSAIEKEIATLNSNPLVIQFVQQQKRKNLEGEICAASKKLSALEIAIKGLKSEKERLEKVSSAMSQDEANQISSDLYNKIRQTNEKEQYTKLPQVIVAIKSEILLISQTIEDLQVRLKEIENQFPIS